MSHCPKIYDVDIKSNSLFSFTIYIFGEGNGNPLQCSCLENPRDGGAWRAAVYGVVQSQTQLKRLSSSSSSSSRIRQITFQHFFYYGQFRKHPLSKLFYLFNLLQMSNDWRMVDTEFFGNFLVVARGPVGCCQLPMTGHCAPHLQSYHLL